MESDIIYEEKIFAKVIGGLLGSVMILMLVIMIYQIIEGPLGDDPAPTLFFLIMFLIFLVLRLLESEPLSHKLIFQHTKQVFLLVKQILF